MAKNPWEIHNDDQQQEAFRPMAKALFNYYKVLMEAGFSKDDALALATSWQSFMLMSTRVTGES